MRNAMLFQVWLLEDDVTNTYGWNDLYLDANKISGFWVASQKENGDKCLAIIFEGDNYTLKQELHLVEYLKKHFLEPSKKIEI